MALMRGVALGVPLALAAQRVAVTFVDNIAAGPTMPIAAAAAMMAVAALAAYVPARRASRGNPIEALPGRNSDFSTAIRPTDHLAPSPYP